MMNLRVGGAADGTPTDLSDILQSSTKPPIPPPVTIRRRSEALRISTLAISHRGSQRIIFVQTFVETGDFRTRCA
jgi:hypothetical protein